MTTKTKQLSIRLTEDQLTRIQEGMKAHEARMERILGYKSEFPYSVSEFVLVAALRVADEYVSKD